MSSIKLFLHTVLIVIVLAFKIPSVFPFTTSKWTQNYCDVKTLLIKSTVIWKTT